MIIKVDRELLIREFQDIRPNDYSIGALNALFNYFEELEEDLGEEIELDVIAICCDFSEYKDLKEFQDNYGTEYKSLNAILEVTEVIEIPSTKGFIIKSF